MERKTIKTVSKYDLQRVKKRREMIAASKRRKEEQATPPQQKAHLSRNSSMSIKCVEISRMKIIVPHCKQNFNSMGLKEFFIHHTVNCKMLMEMQLLAIQLYITNHMQF